MALHRRAADVSGWPGRETLSCDGLTGYGDVEGVGARRSCGRAEPLEGRAGAEAYFCGHHFWASSERAGWMERGAFTCAQLRGG